MLEASLYTFADTTLSYENAIEAARESYTFYYYAPQSLKGQRTRVVMVLKRDGCPAVEEADKVRKPLLVPIDRDAIPWKAHIRAGRAHAALFEAGIKGVDVKKGASGLGPWRHFQRAHHSEYSSCSARPLLTCSTHQDFYEAEGIKTEDISVPKKEVAKLMKVYLWALSADDGTNDKAEVWADMDRITREIYARRAAS